MSQSTAGGGCGGQGHFPSRAGQLVDRRQEGPPGGVRLHPAVGCPVGSARLTVAGVEARRSAVLSEPPRDSHLGTVACGSGGAAWTASGAGHGEPDVADGVQGVVRHRAVRHERRDHPGGVAARVPAAPEPPASVSSSSLGLSILDDVWCLYTRDEDGGYDEVVKWCRRVDAQWSEIGVESHSAKRVDDMEDIEVQGGRVSSRTHLVGLSGGKTTDLMKATFWLLTCYKPSCAGVERIVGKLGHAHTFRTSLRASLGDIFGWSEARGRCHLPPSVWWQLFEAPVFLPLSQLSLSSPWARRLMCSDPSRSSARSGQGLAYRAFPEETI